MAETLSFDIIARDLASKAFKDAGGAAEGFHGKLAALSGLATGAVGVGLTKLGEHLEETRKTLEQTISNAGQSYEEFASQISKAGSHEEKFGHSTADTNDALAILTRATGDTKKSLADMDLVTQIAAVHHSSLAEAAQVVAKAHAGAFRSLKEFGINVKDSTNAAAALGKEEKLVGTTSDELAKAKQKLADLLEIQHSKTKLTVADHIALRNAQDAVTKATDDNADAVHGLARLQTEGGKAMDFATAKTLILQKIHGTAEAQANTFGGKVKELKTRFEDYAAVLGTKVGPALTVAGPALAGIGGIISSGVLPMVAKAIVSFASMAASAVAAFVGMIAEAAVWAASMVASAAIALAPFLPFIAAIAAVVAAGYLLYRNWDTIWKFIKTIIKDAVGFVNDHLTLILTVALGPLGLAIGELKDHWSTVWSTLQTAVQDVWKVLEPIFKFIKRAIDDIAGPLGKVAGAAGSLIKGAGGALSHIPGLAVGGPVSAGRPYLVGELGPELMVPGSAGTIVPNHALGGGGTAFHSVFNIVAPDPQRAAVSVNQGLRDAAFLMGV